MSLDVYEWRLTCHALKPTTGHTFTVENIFLIRSVETAVGVGVSHLKRTATPEPIYLIWTFVCNFVAVYLTFVQFILQIKFCLYTIIHLLLEEFKLSLQSPLSTQTLRHTVSPRVGVGVAQKKTRTPHPVLLHTKQAFCRNVCLRLGSRLLQLSG